MAGDFYDFYPLGDGRLGVVMADVSGKGIPAALFIHTPLEPWYHGPGDTIDKVDPDKVLDVASIVGAALLNGVRKGTPALERSAVAPVPVDYYYEDPHL